MKLPQMMTIGGGIDGKTGANSLEQLIQTLTLRNLNTVAQPMVEK